ncbi:hypothetical protein OG948_13505 [Embleya sp. NBC_00888]|uniref:hypothetical protein n=1 Tax=Embleya sp. NBC_00888 TaxID=2975960 RepID=UPI003870775C|nr:hypothetical protein OG948_13505 [Embleya sp. NBC_00888]
MPPPPTVSGYAFRIFDAEPLLLSKFRNHGWRTGWMLLAAPTSLMLVLILSAIYGEFSTPGIRGQVCSDVATFLHMGKLKCAKDVVVSENFPIWRDIPSLFIILSLAVTPYLAFRQWSSISVFLASMVRNGAIKVRTGADAAAIRAEVANANAYFVRVGRAARFTFAIALICVVLVSVGENKLGVYSIFAPNSTDRRDWGKLVYSHWWASWQVAPVSAFFYLCIGAFGIYFIIVMNLAGSRVLVALWRLRKVLEYQADVHNRDGYYGWAEARGVLLPTYVAILIHGFSLVLISISLPQPIGAWVLAPILLQWIVTLPFYLGLPPLLTRRRIIAFRERQVVLLGIALRRVEANRTALVADHRFYSECEAIAQRIKRVATIRSMPFNRPRDIFLAVLQLLATISGVYSLIILW